MRTRRVLAALLVAVTSPLAAQRATVGPEVRSYVLVDTTVVVLTNARIIDGTGAAPVEGQSIVIRDGRIASVGPSASTAIPAGAQVLDLAGKTVMPGLVMVHEHTYYPTGPRMYGNLAESFTKLYLAGGVTSMRTGGNMNGFTDLNYARDIAAGNKPGPWMDATAPYLDGPGLGLPQLRALKDSADARKQVEYWAGEGFTSFKVYMNIRRAELAAVVNAAHKRGLKVTGHLCSVTYREAAELGIDNLEHGFMAMNDFVPNKAPDRCMGGGGAASQSLARLDVDGAEIKALIKTLVDRKVALTSTLTIFETFVPGRPLPPGLEVLVPQLRQQYEQRHANVSRQTRSAYTATFPRNMALEVAFYRAGGLLVAGTDPTGGGGVIPGFSNQRAIELLVEAGLSPLEAIQVGTLNGAKYLGRDSLVGSIVTGKLADLLVIDGNPAANIADVRKVHLVFKQGIGYDPSALIESVKGRVGLY